MFACNHIGYHRRLNISRLSTGRPAAGALVESFSFNTHVVKRIPKCSYNLLSQLRRAVKPLHDRSPTTPEKNISQQKKQHYLPLESPPALAKALSRTHSHQLNKKKKHLRKRGECITLISAFINLNNNEPIFPAALTSSQQQGRRL